MSLPSDEVVAHWRAEVPTLARRVHDRPLVYLDYAATSQRPQAVIDAMHRAITQLGANVDRGVHQVGAEASAAHVDARAEVASFLSAPSEEVVFTAGTTDALNLAAGCIGAGLGPGDRILVTVLDHHANIVPWQLAAQRVGAAVEPIPLTAELSLDLDAYQRLLEGGSVKVVAFPLVSNVLGTRPPAQALIDAAHTAGAVVVVDAAQAAPHGPIDVNALGADVLAFGAHKVYGPMGIGAMWARRALLERWTPWRGGGGSVHRVSFEGTTFREGPVRLEPGTPNVPAAVGFAAALRWLSRIGWPAIQAREHALTRACSRRLDGIDGLRRLSAEPDAPIFAFELGRIHTHDVGSLLDQAGIAVRSGRHCADPLHSHLGLEGSTRASLSFLTTSAELDALVEGIVRTRELLGG